MITLPIVDMIKVLQEMKLDHQRRLQALYLKYGCPNSDIQALNEEFFECQMDIQLIELKISRLQQRSSHQGSSRQEVNQYG